MDKYIRIKSNNTVAKVIPETKYCWSNAGIVFAIIANTNNPRLFDLSDTEYITEKEYFKGCLGG